VLFHAALIFILFFITLRSQATAPEFVEMSWGGLSPTEGAMSVSPRALDASARSEAPRSDEDNVALPERRASAFPEDAIDLPSSKKKVIPDALPNFSSSKKITGDEQKNIPSSSVSGGKEVNVNASGRSGGAGVTAPFGGTGSGGDGISYGIQWSGGGTRRLESGALPAYPPGVNTEAQIKLKLIVMPNGGVKNAQPMQKGDTRLENAALRAVRHWKFDALQSAQPAVDQSCIVTFNFRLK
jgi:TonB family protein